MFVHLIANLVLFQTVVKHIFGLRFLHGKKREKIIPSREPAHKEFFAKFYLIPLLSLYAKQIIKEFQWDDYKKYK